ncbi:hypothetical protein EXIGLDRAFT_845707 [Exidia glandulosa HHB12029]|uniref:Uncharacterized protein n=1 Tax=Exidia glandulosa HHB12029 TaxID=1314781 RepID=A0A165BBG0_EXIGL|nr:hypothetical protein EXIGLDRAFT_845707 [Exidia glandulosa HHB12029]
MPSRTSKRAPSVVFALLQLSAPADHHDISEPNPRVLRRLESDSVTRGGRTVPAPSHRPGMCTLATFDARSLRRRFDPEPEPESEPEPEPEPEHFRRPPSVIGSATHDPEPEPQHLRRPPSAIGSVTNDLKLALILAPRSLGLDVCAASDGALNGLTSQTSIG